jgi:hypothetical protein
MAMADRAAPASPTILRHSPPGRKIGHMTIVADKLAETEAPCLTLPDGRHVPLATEQYVQAVVDNILEAVGEQLAELRAEIAELRNR